MVDDGPAIHYSAVPRGTPVYDANGNEIGTVDRVMDNHREHILDGFVVRMPKHGLRFVDAPEVARTAERGVTLTITALFFNLMWRYAIGGGGRLLRPDADRREVDGITRSYRPGVPMYAAATVVGGFQAELGAALFAAIALFYVLSSAVFGREEGAVP